MTNPQRFAHSYYIRNENLQYPQQNNLQIPQIQKDLNGYSNIKQMHPPSNVIENNRSFSQDSSPMINAFLDQNLPSSSRLDLLYTVNLQPKSNKRKRKCLFHPRVERVERALNMNKYIDQIDKLLEQPIKIPATLSIFPGRDKQIPGKARRDLFSVTKLWENTDHERLEKSKLYNTTSLGERDWLLDMMLEESDPESGGEELITQEDLTILLKIHKKRRKYQQDYHRDILNSQYTYYGAGLLSEHDRFPEHQANVKKEFSYIPKE